MAERLPLVLICEDELPLRELIRVSLGPGYRFREAGTVAESIGLLEAEPPDVVVLDLMLPGGTGLDVLRTIRADEAFSRTSVLIVSAWTDEANRRAVEEEGADGFVAKPFAPEELADQVEELLVPARRRGWAS
jgi:two-component system, OmpR family, phosphate regulon response regulator PhoB